jgi:hypothetical protein
MESQEPGARADRAAAPSSNEAEVARMKVLRGARVRALLARRGVPTPQPHAASVTASAALIVSAHGGDQPLCSPARRHPR